MKSLRRLALLLFLLNLVAGAGAPGRNEAHAQPGPGAIPDALRPWESWATWNDPHRFCPSPWNDGARHRCHWPGRLSLAVSNGGGGFEISVRVFGPSWVPLPGGPGAWPLEVMSGTEAVPVLERAGVPSVRLSPGTHVLHGGYRWNALPQRIPIPGEVGLLSLVLEGRAVEQPAWDAQGFLWFRRDGLAESGERDFLSLKIHSVLEDGIPLWFRRELELTVSGRSREVELGHVLPEGWKLSLLEAAIPVAVDANGRLKAQVRAGKWTIRADAFRMDNPDQIRFGPGVKPAAAEELFAFRSRPEFRVLEIGGVPSIDVSQTPFPEKWRELPVYRWDTSGAVRLEQRLRGMGDQKPAGLSIQREWWLDEDGGGLTFRDRIGGAMQQVWRLDVAPGSELGSVRSAGEGQLITRNPQTGAPGIELRTRQLNLEATGRMPFTPTFPATGWQSDADAVGVVLNLPPGWRLFALTGADWVSGDWLTAWTLLDLFLLLIFSLTVFRLWGVGPALLAFLAFGLAYHEAGAPRFPWLVLLVPIALERAVTRGWGRTAVRVARNGVVLALVLLLAPFIAQQVQQALYPQLEVVRAPRGLFARGRAYPQPVVTGAELPVQQAVSAMEETAASPGTRQARGPWSKVQSLNLAYDAQARIQTGPGVPQWNWRQVQFGWNGPVRSGQQVRLVLVPLWIERLLTVTRIGLLLALAAVLLRPRRNRTPETPSTGGSAAGTAGPAALALLVLLGASCVFPGAARAADPVQTSGTASTGASFLPDAEMLAKLRERLLAVPDAFPHAADIPLVSVTLEGRRLVLEAEIHAGALVAVPLPGRLPAWSPVGVTVDGAATGAVRRDDGFLWVALSPGVHRVRVEGVLAGSADWECAFLLRPRQVRVVAPGWSVSGIRADGVPEAQVFFSPQQRQGDDQPTYERPDLEAVAQVERQLELGLVWQVRTVVKRLSPVGKAIALRIPLLPGENVLNAGAMVRDGAIEIRIGAQELAAGWESSLGTAARLELVTRTNDVWVERWQLLASPVWNVGISGLSPVFEATNAVLTPVWQPWPGEVVNLAVSRPEAVAGATMTVGRAVQECRIGRRQVTSSLDLELRCSQGDDFMVDLPADAVVTALTHGGKDISVRKDGRRVIIPVRPGEQAVRLEWKVNTGLGARAGVLPVQLPVASANVDTVIHVGEDRWVLWADGPQRGPAVRFWGILVCSLIAAGALGLLPLRPLGRVEWMLLAIGLTQVPLPAALVVVAWLFALAWRGRSEFGQVSMVVHNLVQVALVALTLAAMGVLVFAVGEGLLGDPEMFIAGNGSQRLALRWYLDRAGVSLPTPSIVSVSIWWYRFLMLLWALWLALALIRWLRTGWGHFSSGGILRRQSARSVPPTPAVVVPPPLPREGSAKSTP